MCCYLLQEFSKSIYTVYFLKFFPIFQLLHCVFYFIFACPKLLNFILSYPSLLYKKLLELIIKILLLMKKFFFPSIILYTNTVVYIKEDQNSWSVDNASILEVFFGETSTIHLLRIMLLDITDFILPDCVPKMCICVFKVCYYIFNHQCTNNFSSLSSVY